MSLIYRQWKNRLQYSNKRNNLSIDVELKSISDKLLNENSLLKTRFDKFEETYHQWINDERIYLLNRLEKLENENHQFYEIFQTYENCIRSITNLIIKILLTQQELSKQNIERDNANDSVQWRKRQQQNGSITRTTRSISCELNDSRYPINDQSIWFHQVKEQDQKTTNYSSELNNHSSTLATVKSKSEKPSTALANKLYYVLNNEKTPIKSIRDNHHSTGINIIPIDDSKNIPHRKQQSSVTFNKNQTQTRSTYSNHERLPTQTSYRTSPIVKNTQTKTTTVSKPPRVSTITNRSPTTNTRQPPSTTNQKPVSTTNKSPRPRYTLPKSSEPIRSVGATTTRPRSGQPNISPTKTTPGINNIKTRIPIVPQQSARVTDLDKLMSERTVISRSLFSKDSVKIVRPVRSQELKLFSCHLIPEITIQTNESLSTLTPSSHQSINDKQIIEEKINSINRDFSEDSLNEHYHIQKLLKQNSINDNPQDHLSTEQEKINKEEYFLSTNENLNPPYTPSLSLKKSKPISSLIHRLVFPERLGRMIFYRRILSDSDIYQKICSKDNEIFHNVYHLDTIRDYSMEYYMLTTYASDSQLRAWIDSDDDDIRFHLNENRFLSSDDDEINKNSVKLNSSENLIQNEELDWYSELELVNLTNPKTETTSSSSSDIHIGECFSSQPTSTDSWTIPTGGSNQLHSTPLPSDRSDESNSILREILNHSWTDDLSRSNSIEQETGIEQFENDSTSSIITDEFQSDFYYLCPITKTTSFSKT